MVAINALFLVLSAVYSMLGVSFFFFPSSHTLLGYDSSLLVKFLASSYNRVVIVPLWAGLQIALASVTFYATTMPSAHDKAKVARGVLFALVGALQANVVDAWAAKQSRVFSDPTLLAYGRIAVLLALTAWCLVESFSATADDAQPIRASAKKNTHASTPSGWNNVYLRAFSLVLLVQGCICWFAPSHLGLIGLGHPQLATSVFTAFATTSIGALLVALATVAGYGATFQSTHGQAKLARSFLLYAAVVLGYDGYAAATGGHGANDAAMWAHVAVDLVFTVWSLVVSFSATTDDVVNRAVKTTVKKH